MLRKEIAPTVNRFFLVALLAAGTLTLAGCDSDDGPAEEAGEQVDQAAEEARDATEEVGDEVQEKAEQTGDQIENATE